jgi:hypothetical protein
LQGLFDAVADMERDAHQRDRRNSGANIDHRMHSGPMSRQQPQAQQQQQQQQQQQHLPPPHSHQLHHQLPQSHLHGMSLGPSGGSSFGLDGPHSLASQQREQPFLQGSSFAPQQSSQSMGGGVGLHGLDRSSDDPFGSSNSLLSSGSNVASSRLGNISMHSHLQQQQQLHSHAGSSGLGLHHQTSNGDYFGSANQQHQQPPHQHQQQLHHEDSLQSLWPSSTAGNSSVSSTTPSRNSNSSGMTCSTLCRLTTTPVRCGRATHPTMVLRCNLSSCFTTSRCCTMAHITCGWSSMWHSKGTNNPRSVSRKHCC